MKIERSPWWILLITLFLCRIGECEDEKIKRAIYNYQRTPKEPSGGKTNDEYFKKFQGISPFEQVLAALGLSGDDHSKIHTSVEYWPPDMDREKFYQMVRGESFPSWNYEPKSHSAPESFPKNPVKPIFSEEIQDKVPLKINTPIKKPENSLKKKKPSNYYPQFIDYAQSYPQIDNYEEKLVDETPKHVEDVPKHVPQVFEEVSDYPEYPTYVEESSTAPTYYEKLPEIVKEAPKVGTLKIKEVFKPQHVETPSFHYILQTPKSPKSETSKIVKVTPKIIMEAYTTSTATTLKPKLSKAKYYIHTSKLPAQPELPSSPYNAVMSSIIENESDNNNDDDDISMTDAGPVLFPDVTTLRNKVQRGSLKSLVISQQKNHHHQHVHEERHEVNSPQQNQQQPTRSNKKRKLKKKVKTSSIAQEVVDIGNRGSSGKLHTTQYSIIDATSTTIAPKTSFTSSASLNYIAVTDDKDGGGIGTTNLSDGYVDPNYSDMIDNLSKLTELTFNTKAYNTEIVNDNVPKIYSTSTASTTELSPVTETFNNHSNFEFDYGNTTSIVTDENMIAVLNLMRNTSTTMSSSSMDELKKAVIENNLPKVKKIVRQHVGKRPLIEILSTTESSSVTRGKLLRSRFGIKTKVTSSSQATTESSTTSSSNSSSSTVRTRKNLKKSVTSVKQVISTTAKSIRSNIRTRPSTTPKSMTSKSTSKSIARRVTTTRKSIKSALSA